LESPSGTAGLAEEKDRALGRIESVLITPMATGCGGVSPERWAAQFVLATRHFVDAIERPERWKGLGWGDIYEDTKGVVQTWKM
jgi:O-acetyl-ADP-ribose deacetylase (regulator of RNase III)